MIRFFVPGPPIAQPRQRHRIVGKGKKSFIQNYVESKHPVHAYKGAVRFGFHAKLIEGPVMLELLFLMPRPQATIWKTKPMPRYRHVGKPDLDNLVKAVQDALKGIAWVDDSQVMELHAAKWVASGSEMCGVWAEITEIIEEGGGLYDEP